MARELSRVRRRPVVCSTLALVALTGVGCGSVKQSGTARTATEQLLLTNSWDRALEKVDFRQLTGIPVFLDTSNVTAVDQGWIVSSLREAMLTQGVLIRPKAEQAQFIVEARVGAYGTDDYNWMFGISQTTIPPTVTGMPTGTIPEIPLVKKTDQKGITKLALFAYDRTSGQLMWKSGTQLEVATATDRYVGGMGPFRSGTIRNGTEIDGIKVPLVSGEGGEGEGPASSPEAAKKSRWWRRKSAPPAAKPETLPAPKLSSPAPMAAKSDQDAFRP